MSSPPQGLRERNSPEGPDNLEFPESGGNITREGAPKDSTPCHLPKVAESCHFGPLLWTVGV
jgi:hypothetical protein